MPTSVKLVLRASAGGAPLTFDVDFLPKLNHKHLIFSCACGKGCKCERE